MTVENTNPIQHFTANGISKVYSFNFLVEGKDNLVVSANEVTVDPSEYSYIEATRSIEFNTVPTVGTEITVERKTALTRSINYQTYDNSFRPETLNYDFDRIWRVLQEKGIESAKTLSGLIKILEQLSDADRKIVEALIEQTRTNIAEDVDNVELIIAEAKQRKEQDKLYNVLQQIQNGSLGNELKNYFNTVVATQTPHVFDGIDTNLIFEGDESQKQINEKQKFLNDINKDNNDLNVLSYFTKAELAEWKKTPDSFDASDAIIRAQQQSQTPDLKFPQGTFVIKKKIPSTKNWIGVKASYNTLGTKIIVDSADEVLDGVIDMTNAAVDIELHGIHFQDKQHRKHTLFKSKNGYQTIHTGLKINAFKIGFQVKGTYDYFEDCYFLDNEVGIKPIASNETNQSTMYGFTRCYWLYNKVGVDAQPTMNIGSYEDWMNIQFSSCGFEANETGINAPQRMWYVTFLNCWFEANSEHGLYAPTSHTIEINTRHNANSKRVVDPENSSVIFGMKAELVELLLKNNLNFKDIYLQNSVVNQDGNSISQKFTDDYGAATSMIRFVREAGVNNTCGSGIVLSTTTTTGNSEIRDHWKIDRYGTLKATSDFTHDIGSATNRCKAIYTTQTMYTDSVGDFFGEGSPENVVSAAIGSTYRNISDDTLPKFWIKKTGLTKQGWVAVA